MPGNGILDSGGHASLFSFVDSHLWKSKGEHVMVSPLTLPPSYIRHVYIFKIYMLILYIDLGGGSRGNPFDGGT